MLRPDCIWVFKTQWEGEREEKGRCGNELADLLGLGC